MEYLKSETRSLELFVKLETWASEHIFWVGLKTWDPRPCKWDQRPGALVVHTARDMGPKTVKVEPETQDSENVRQLGLESKEPM